MEKKSFYLDLKNHAVATKLETHIRELGGVSCILPSLRVRRCCVYRLTCSRVSRFRFSPLIDLSERFGVYFERVFERPLCPLPPLFLSLSLSPSVSFCLPSLRPAFASSLFPPFSITMTTLRRNARFALPASLSPRGKERNVKKIRISVSRDDALSSRPRCRRNTTEYARDYRTAGPRGQTRSRKVPRTQT